MKKVVKCPYHKLSITSAAHYNRIYSTVQMTLISRVQRSTAPYCDLCIGWELSEWIFINTLKPLSAEKIGIFLISYLEMASCFCYSINLHHIVRKLLTSSGRALRLLILCWNSSVSISCHDCTLIAHYLHTVCTLSALDLEPKVYTKVCNHRECTY